MADFTGKFLAGLAVGQRHAKDRQDFEAAQEDRDLKRQMLKHEMDRLKIQDALHEREIAAKEAQDQAGLVSGASSDTAGLPGGPPGPPAPPAPFKNFDLPAAGGLPAAQMRVPTYEGKQQSVLDAFNEQTKQKIEVAKATEEARAANRPVQQPTVATLAIAAAKGDKTAQAAMATLKPAKNSGVADDDANAIADAIVSGDQPPTTAGLYRFAGPVKAALAKKGYDFTSANLDWEATKRHLATLNGVKQTTLRQAASTAYDSLDVIDGLAKQWQGSQLPLLNKANLALAKQGILGKPAQQLAVQLEGQITDVVSELGQVYMGGNSPTDHALKLAEKNLSADWEQGTLLKMTELARKNLQIRLNSMNHSAPITTKGGGIEPQSEGADTSGYKVIKVH